MVGKARSCIACRQAKMACDARKKAPGPCWRCKDKNMECRFDKNFKRIPTRQITSSLTNELHNMRATQYTSEGTSVSPRPPSAARDPEEHARFLQISEGEIVTDLSIGAVGIPPEVVLELLRHFEQHYYIRAAFLQPIQSPASCASESPLLFWTILFIASQHHESHSHLYEKLFFPHRDLLAPLTTCALHSIQEIHALLLLCLWPIPKQREVLNPIWNYIGLAISACIRLDIHNPLPQDHILQGWGGWPRTLTSVSLETQRLTWLACFSISTQESVWLGFVPPLSSCYHLKNTRKAVNGLDGHLKPEQLASIAIYENMCHYSVALEGIDEPSTHFLLTQSHNGSLDIVKQTYAADWPREVDIVFQLAKLNLHSTALVPYLQKGCTREASHIIDLQTLLLRGLEAASNLIEGIKAVCLAPAPAPATADTHGDNTTTNTILPFAPKHYFTNLFFAALFLFRTYVLSQPISQTHKALAYQGMVDVHEIFQQLPQRRDIARAAILVEKLLSKARLHETTTTTTTANSSSLNELLITNRLGASIVWDTVLRVRLRTNVLTVAANGVVEREVHPVEEAVRDRLPPAPEMMLQETSGGGVAAGLDGFMPQSSEDLIWADWNLFVPQPGYSDMGQMFW